MHATNNLFYEKYIKTYPFVQLGDKASQLKISISIKRHYVFIFLPFAMFDGYFFERAVFMNNYSGNTFELKKFEKRRNFFSVKSQWENKKWSQIFFLSSVSF
jgi:hypothetical protein